MATGEYEVRRTMGLGCLAFPLLRYKRIFAVYKERGEWAGKPHKKSLKYNWFRSELMFGSHVNFTLVEPAEGRGNIPDTKLKHRRRQGEHGERFPQRGKVVEK